MYTNVFFFSSRSGWREFGGRTRWVYGYVDIEPVNSQVDVQVVRLLFATVPLDLEVKPLSHYRDKSGRLRVSMTTAEYGELPSGLWRGTFRRDREYPPGKFDYVVTLQKVVRKESPIGAGISGST